MSTLIERVESRAAQLVVIINATDDRAKANRLCLAYFRLIRFAATLQADRLRKLVRGY